MRTVLALAVLLWTTRAVASSPDYSYLLDVTEVKTNLDAEIIARLPPRICLQTVVLHVPSYADIQRVAIVGEENAQLCDALAQLPGITVVAEDDAQLLIDYFESEDEGEWTWEAQLFRLKCQDQSAEPPCATRVYVRTYHDSMSGTPTAGHAPVHDFADQLLDALLTAAARPPAAPNP